MKALFYKTVDSTQSVVVREMERGADVPRRRRGRLRCRPSSSLRFLEAGGKFLINELAANSGAVEVVVVARPVKAAAQEPPPAAGTQAAFEFTVSVEDCPFLRSHVMNGKAVVPTAILAEWLAHGALGTPASSSTASTA